MQKEIFWIEFNVRSNIRNLISITLSDKKIESESNGVKTSLGSMVTKQEYSQLFVDKLPLFLKDMIAQLSQEIKIEAAPDLMNFILDDRSIKLTNKITAKLGTGIKDIKPAKNVIRYSKDDRIFYKKIGIEASPSALDKAIVSNINRIDSLVYLFKKQTILKNHVFFDLFQHWFETPYDESKIDELMYQLKKKAGLIRKGPASFLIKDKIKIIARYYWLISLFSIMKKIAKEPPSTELANQKWDKLSRKMNEIKCFDIDKKIAIQRLRYQGYNLADFLRRDWLKEQFGLFNVWLAKYDMSEEEFKDDIKDFVQEEKSNNRKLNEIGKSLREYLLNQSISVIIDTEPSELASHYLSIIEKTSKRQIKRIIENNKPMAQTIQERLSRILG